MGFEVGNKAALGANHKKPKQITQKLIARLNDSEGAAMDRLISALLEKALGGDVVAIREILDRVDGKVPQGLIGGDETDAPVRFEQVLRHIVRPDHSDG